MNRSREFFVGLVFFGLLAVLGVFTVFLADFRFGDRPKTRVAFEDVAGLEPGAGVWINGVRSGEVAAVERVPGKNQVLVELEFDEEPALKEGTTFRVEDTSLLGGKVVTIWNGEVDRPLDLDRIQEGDSGGGMLDDFKDVAREISDLLDRNAERIDRAIADVSSAAAEARAMIAENRERIGSALESIDAAATAAERMLRENEADVRRAVAGIAAVAGPLEERGPSILANVERATRDVADVAARLSAGEGSLGRLLADDTLIRRLEQAADDLTAVTADAREGKGTLGRLINDPRLYDEALATVEKLNSAATRIDEALGAGARDSVVGFLLNDKEAAENLRNAVQELSRFLETQRESAPLTTFAGLLFKAF